MEPTGPVAASIDRSAFTLSVDIEGPPDEIIHGAFLRRGRHTYLLSNSLNVTGLRDQVNLQECVEFIHRWLYGQQKQKERAPVEEIVDYLLHEEALTAIAQGGLGDGPRHPYRQEPNINLSEAVGTGSLLVVLTTETREEDGIKVERIICTRQIVPASPEEAARGRGRQGTSGVMVEGGHP